MDASAFERLVREHQHLVYCVALSVCKDPAAAEDLAQEAFLKAYRSVDDVREPAVLKTWLYSIARFTAIDWVRRRKHERWVGLTVEAASALSERPEAETKEDRTVRVMDVIRGLKDEHREIMILRYVRGLSYAQIAKATGLTASAVGEKLSRIRDLVRQKIRAEVRT
ncbi:MAG TPA: sigma-70 family RNA polymerase sigma factor [Planctomycetota bacterium]|nr:sigma-70 family RNA polymerase sigma factor [Planctomycetota bacterium]